MCLNLLFCTKYIVDNTYLYHIMLLPIVIQLSEIQNLKGLKNIKMLN